MTKLVLATRQSALAMWQTRSVMQSLQRHDPRLHIELLPLLTSGDKNSTAPLYEQGGKALFVKELEQALLSGHADLAVHSLKDMPYDLPPDLMISAYCQREDPRDALIHPQHLKFSELSPGSVIGTSSPRRECLIHALRPDLNVKLLRGNVDTRLRKLEEGHYDAILLAAAGLIRLQQHAKISDYLSPVQFIPATGQGIIAVECHRNNTDLQNRLRAVLNDEHTEICALAERAFNRHLAGDCRASLAAHARFNTSETLQVQGMVGNLQGTQVIQAQVMGSPARAEALGTELAMQLLAQGAERLLKGSSL